MCDCFTRRSGYGLCVIFTHKLRRRQCYTTYGTEVKVMKWWLFWLALINRKIEQRYYKKRRQHLHRIYIRWEKEDPKEREAYRKWKPKAIEAFNTVWVETYKIDIPDSAKPKKKKHNKKGG